MTWSPETQGWSGVRAAALSGSRHSRGPGLAPTTATAWGGWRQFLGLWWTNPQALRQALGTLLGRSRPGAPGWGGGAVFCGEADPE